MRKIRKIKAFIGIIILLELEDEWVCPHGKGINYEDNFAFTYDGNKPIF